jgi:small subunit ribosomal protein S13
LVGTKKLVVALSDLKGVGYNYANIMVLKLGLDPRVRLGMLSENQVKDIERVLQDASGIGVPQWAFNRRRDLETGETKQLIGSDLDFSIKNDVQREQNVQSWRGTRHLLGLKVRGQRTRTTGRKGRTVGVRKAAAIAAARAAATEEKKEEKK